MEQNVLVAHLQNSVGQNAMETPMVVVTAMLIEKNKIWDSLTKNLLNELV